MELHLVQVQQLDPLGGPILPYRYDEKTKEKFDYAVRIKPIEREFHSINRQVKPYFKKRREGSLDVLKIPEKLALADINIKTRRKIGLIIGSIAKKLFNAPDDISGLESGSDVDVLILNPHSDENPEPMEWGVDWFVRPRNRAPTNGLVQMWYDVCLNEERCRPDKTGTPQKLTAIQIDLKKRVVQYEPEGENDPLAISRRIQKTRAAVELASGLYLPDTKFMSFLSDFCNARRNEMFRILKELKNEMASMNESQFNKNRESMIQRLNIVRRWLHLDPLSLKKITEKDSFKIMFLEAKVRLEREKKYDYLKYPEGDGSRALLSILPGELLKFTEMP